MSQVQEYQVEIQAVMLRALAGEIAEDEATTAIILIQREIINLLQQKAA